MKGDTKDTLGEVVRLLEDAGWHTGASEKRDPDEQNHDSGADAATEALLAELSEFSARRKSTNFWMRTLDVVLPTWVAVAVALLILSFFFRTSQ